MTDADSRTAGALDRGREHFERRAWAEAYAQWSAADQESPLDATDLERLAAVAYLLGRDADWGELWTRAHREYLARDDRQQAARCAFWLAYSFLDRGETARSNGWIARARRLLADDGRDCVEQGYLLVPAAMEALAQGRNTTAHAAFAQSAEIGQRFGDRDLVAIARHGQGRALIRLGEAATGIALLDEVMVAVTSGELSPIVAGDVYCGMISACHEIFDLRRATEWTTALSAWCAARPDLVPYRGQCMIRRAEIMQFHGAWPEAVDEARRACERLSRPPGQPGVGAAFYQMAELHRLRGEFASAEEAYRHASDSGRKPHPGLAVLRLAQGQIDAARAAIGGAVEEAHDRRLRSRLLAPYVEIMLAANDVPAARRAADELSDIAATVGAPVLEAMARQATGAVLLAEGNPGAAMSALQRALTVWCELEMPYEAARARALVGVASRELGDHDTGEMELDAACRVFQQVGAKPDLARVAALRRKARPDTASRLTARELQVLRLLAAGKTNRAIAQDLGISEKTVARHVSNIFTKLGLATRAAAAAYAYQHHLVRVASTT